MIVKKKRKNRLISNVKSANNYSIHSIFNIWNHELYYMNFQAEEMNTLSNGFKLGFGSFVDKPVMPYVSTAKNK